MYSGTRRLWFTYVSVHVNCTPVWGKLKASDEKRVLLYKNSLWLPARVCVWWRTHNGAYIRERCLPRMQKLYIYIWVVNQIAQDNAQCINKAAEVLAYRMARRCLGYNLYLLCGRTGFKYPWWSVPSWVVDMWLMTTLRSVLILYISYTRNERTKKANKEKPFKENIKNLFLLLKKFGRSTAYISAVYWTVCAPQSWPENPLTQVDGMR